jgi:Family of unknown function (DUF6768)
MTEFDEKLKEALAGDDGPASELGREQSLFGQVASVFKSRQRWLIIYAMVLTVALMALAVWSILGLLEADDFRTHILYGLGAAFSLISVAMLKIWFFMQMNRNAVLREIVRLQIQVAELSQKLDAK